MSAQSGSWQWQSGTGVSTQIGVVNPKGQRCAGHRGIPGTDHGQYAYKIECTLCGYVYGANGSDLHERRCPECQGGAPGIRYWQRAEEPETQAGLTGARLSGLDTRIFHLTGFDEGGVAGSADNLRLVCILRGGGKLAIWGKISSRRNIDTVLNAGVPCTIECDYRQPNDVHAKKFGHRYWVREDCRLRIVRTGLDRSA